MTLNEYTKIVVAKRNKLALRDKTNVVIPYSNACDYYRNHLPKGPTGASIDKNISEILGWNIL